MKERHGPLNVGTTLAEDSYLLVSDVLPILFDGKSMDELNTLSCKFGIPLVVAVSDNWSNSSLSGSTKWLDHGGIRYSIVRKRRSR